MQLQGRPGGEASGSLRKPTKAERAPRDAQRVTLRAAEDERSSGQAGRGLRLGLGGLRMCTATAKDGNVVKEVWGASGASYLPLQSYSLLITARSMLLAGICYSTPSVALSLVRLVFPLFSHLHQRCLCPQMSWARRSQCTS